VKLWHDHGTKVLGFLQVSVAAVAAVPGLFPPEWMPKVLAVTGLLTAWRGFVNSAQAKQ
jgi:hypothetical protein